MKPKHSYSYPLLLGVSALSISISSAYYSVYGLGALFAGAALQIMVMAATLEFAKVLLAGFLHRFWDGLPRVLRSYLSGAVIVLIVISSMGIYGYLASAYQNSNLELGSVQSRVDVLEQRKQRYAQQIQTINQERGGLTNTILTLSEGLSSNVIQYVDPQTGQLITTQSSAARNIIQQQLSSARDREGLLSSQVDALSDSLIALDNRIFSIKDESSASKNLGPLMFLAEVTGMSMDRVVNVLIVTIMLVFDPLAVTMIIATSVAFDKVRDQRVQQADQDSDQDSDQDFKVFEVYKQPPSEKEGLESLDSSSDQYTHQPQVEPKAEDPKVDQTVKEENKQPLPPTPTQKVENIYGEQLEQPEKVRKVTQIKHVGNYTHVHYDDYSVDRIPQREFKKLQEDNKKRYM